MKIDLPFPADALWPNKRPHRMAKSRAAKKAKELAYYEAKTLPMPELGDDLLPIKITVHPHKFGPPPDSDNTVAAAKAYLDGIALAIGINDRRFKSPVVEFSPERTSRFVVEVGHG